MKTKSVILSMCIVLFSFAAMSQDSTKTTSTTHKMSSKHKTMHAGTGMHKKGMHKTSSSTSTSADSTAK